MIRLSTALRNSLAASYGIMPHMQGGVIYVFGGDPPPSPDSAAYPDQALGVVTTEGLTFVPPDDLNNAGLQLEFVAPGTLINVGRWVLTATAAGEARWFRWYRKTFDTYEDSAYYPRIDGSIGDVLVLVTPLLTVGKKTTIDSFRLQIPMGN